MKSKIFLFFAIVSVAGMLAMSGCDKDDDEQSGNGGKHEWVDLGLPSGTLWATCNVGAKSPEDYGDYFAWGETVTKKNYTDKNYKYTDNPTTLPPKADVATAKWGTGWRMPTKEEMQELIDNCDITGTAMNGINGMLITSRINGKTIFMPAAGCHDDEFYDVGSFGWYWLSSLNTNNRGYAWCLSFYSDIYVMTYDDRYDGFSVRPVCDR